MHKILYFSFSKIYVQYNSIQTLTDEVFHQGINELLIVVHGYI